MAPSEAETELSNAHDEYKKLATNTFFSFLINYGSHFFTFIYSFLLARLITDQIWEFLIIATSFISIIVLITTLLPPGLNFALNYYIPRYLALNQKSMIKSLIKNAILTKLIFVIPVYIISIIAFSYLTDIFAITLSNKISLLYILSPLIIINSFNVILAAVNRGFSKFNFLFSLLIIKNVIHILPLLFYFLFDYNIEVELIAIIVMFSSLVPFIINFLSVILRYLKIKSEGNKTEAFKESFSKTFKYGSYTGLTDNIMRFWKEIQLQGISVFEPLGVVTGYNIALNYRSLSSYSAASFRFPLMTSFSGLSTKEKFDQVNKIYKITYRVNLFLLLIISGVLFFSVDFVLDFVFLEDRLIYSTILKLVLIATIFRMFGQFLQTLLNAQNKVKLPLILQITYMLYIIPLFFIGLIFFEGIRVEVAIILGLIIGNIISLVIQILATHRFGNIKLNIKRMVFQYLTFFIPLGITLMLESVIFKELSFNIIQNLGLSLFKNFDFLSIGAFVLLFISMNLILKTVTTNDIQQFESFFVNKDKTLNKIVLKILSVLKKITRD
ncbi:MAG: hypothetical protein CEE43_13400 [Promethearchaeota archaeon Loki_b32]|nr:MAG: hypothetical protein CEE43_13400 [Candidatus Lokiarchaeota archaeon Loki_b32]